MKKNTDTLYGQIVEYLIKKIENKEIVIGDKLPTEQELMKDFNVSRITAKKALEELKNMGLIYRKKGHGSFLSSTIDKEFIKQKVVSMIIPYENSTGRFIDYIRGAGDYLYKKGYFLSVNCTDGDEFKEREYLINFSKSQVKGIIYYPTNRTKSFDILYLLSENKYPIAVIDKYFESLPISYSVSDNFAGGFEACMHLIKLGHRKIAFISSVDIGSISSLRDRFLGYCKALKDNNIEIHDDFIVNEFSNNKTDNLNSICKKLLKKGATAIISENDYVALDIMKNLVLEGLKIPNDISLVGFDNIPILQQMDISLTTIEQNFYEIGRKAAEIVIENIEGRDVGQVKSIIPIKLIKGESTKKIG